MQRLAITLALGFALFHPTALNARSSAATAAASPCDFEHRIHYQTSFSPSPPCDGAPLNLVVHACAECDHIIGGYQDPAAWIGGGAVHLRFLSRQACPRIPCQPESLVIPLIRPAAGDHSLQIIASASVFIAGTDSTFCEVSQTDTLTFQVGFCPPPPPDSLPFVTQVRIGPPSPCLDCPSTICPGDSFPVFVAGVFPNQCYDLRGVELLPSPLMGPRPEPPIVRLLVAVADGAEACLGPPQPFRASVRLPGLPSGPYGLILEEAWTAWDDTSHIDTVFTAVLPFAVARTCSTGPPPRTPLVHRIHMGTLPCPTCPPVACPGDSIPTVITGSFPDHCWEFKGVEVFPSDAGGIVPQPPRLRVNLSRNDCLDRLCLPEVVPFAARLKLPPLPTGAYTLEVEERQTVLCGVPPDTFFRHTAAFRVAERCSTGTSPGCFITDWLHGSEPCDTFVGHGQPGQVTLTALSNTVPMAGLQGTLSLHPAGLRITGLTAVGSAATWPVAWEPTADGARFVMFSTDGTVIPETDPVFPPAPVLGVTVATADGTPPAPVTYLTAGDLRASDPRGVDIPPCPLLPTVIIGARICFRGVSCDVNLDGAVDIRDLVVMVHCVDGTRSCPEPNFLDCNGDGQSTLDDVLCCAQVVLRGTMPGSGPARPEPSVQVSFGASVPTASGFDVPLRIDGADRLGAARLSLRFPSDRFDVAGVLLPAGASEWLGLNEVDGSGLRIGLIRVGPQEIARGGLELTLRLRLRAGQTAGGELRLESGDFSGPDAAALRVDFTPATLPIGGDARLLLSAPQPSPFPFETRFALSLPRPEEVELSVHDLAGRRLATLFRARLDAGTRVFRWAGTDDGGARVRDGIYFIHARVAGADVSRKVVLLRGD